VVYKRSGNQKDRVHAEKPPITPLKMPESQLSAFGKELAALPAGKASDLQVIDWSTAITETPVSGTKLFCSKNEKNERFSFSIVLPIGRYHNLKHDLAISYLSLLGTETKDLTTFDSELYKLALDMNFEVDEYKTTLTVSGLQKYLPQALRLLTERLILAKADPAAYTRFVERIKKARADARKEPGNYLFAARTFAVYGGKNNPLFHVLSPKELEAIKPEELTAHLRAIPTSMPREFVYYGPASPDEVASLIKTILPAPAEKQIAIPEPVKFKIQPPQENLVYLIRHPSAQIIACLTRTDTIRIPADTAAALIIDEYTNPLYFQELREKQSLGYIAQAAYSVPGIHPDNYSQFIALLGTQPDKLSTGMQAMRNMTNDLPQDQPFFNTIRSNTLTALQTRRIKPENLYWYRLEMVRLKRPLDQAARDHARIKAMTSTQFYALAKEAMNRSKDLWVLSGNVTEKPKGFGKVIELTPADILPE
ncbi:MAG: insulinase family protein, partial [Lentisphaeria bacterium]|nr:insulinase family protein [Lentisphaeria bacterium]